MPPCTKVEVIPHEQVRLGRSDREVHSRGGLAGRAHEAEVKVDVLGALEEDDGVQARRGR